MTQRITLAFREETPPLTRGRQTVFLIAASSTGNTPAYAGKTWILSRLVAILWKHPRLRGEDVTRLALWQGTWETPPLTRGRQKLGPDFGQPE